MIRDEQMNFTQIAEALGYSSIHYFSRQFKKLAGMTPSEYASSIRAISERPPLYMQHTGRRGVVSDRAYSACRKYPPGCIRRGQDKNPCDLQCCDSFFHTSLSFLAKLPCLPMWTLLSVKSSRLLLYYYKKNEPSSEGSFSLPEGTFRYPFVKLRFVT